MKYIECVNILARLGFTIDFIKVERRGLKGELTGKEVLVFTDNTTAESIAHLRVYHEAI